MEIHEVKRENDLCIPLGSKDSYIYIILVIIYNENSNYSVTIQPKNLNTFCLTEILSLEGARNIKKMFLERSDIFVFI